LNVLMILLTPVSWFSWCACGCVLCSMAAPAGVWLSQPDEAQGRTLVSATDHPIPARARKVPHNRWRQRPSRASTRPCTAAMEPLLNSSGWCFPHLASGRRVHEKDHVTRAPRWCDRQLGSGISAGGLSGFRQQPRPPLSRLRRTPLPGLRWPTVQRQRTVRRSRRPRRLLSAQHCTI